MLPMRPHTNSFSENGDHSISSVESSSLGENGEPSISSVESSPLCEHRDHSLVESKSHTSSAVESHPSSPAPSRSFREIEERVIELMHSPAGIGPLNELVAINPFNLDRGGRIDYLAALEKQSAWLQSVMQRAIVAVAGDGSSPDETVSSETDEMEREDVATALRLSGSTAQSRIDVARLLTQHLPVTCEALANGEISAATATVIAKESATAIYQGLDEEKIREFETAAVAHAEFHTPAQVGNKLRSIIAKLSPEQFEASVEAARETRKVQCFPESNGMATIIALLPAADAQTVMLALDKFARVHRDAVIAESESLTTRDFFIDNLRADALTSLASAYLEESKEIGLGHRRPTSLNLTMDLPTLLGLQENPAILNGYGAIPASVARELAADAKWRRFVTDPVSGNLLDYGRETYEPPQALVDFVLARDRVCRFPGCRQPGRLADIDHAHSWESGGKTSAENLGLLCRRHHQLKTHGGWLLKSFPDGSCEWTSPLKRKYIVPARRIDEVA